MKTVEFHVEYKKDSDIAIKKYWCVGSLSNRDPYIGPAVIAWLDDPMPEYWFKKNLWIKTKDGFIKEKDVKSN